MALGALVVHGKYAGSTTGAPSLVVSSLSDTFNPYTFASGHAPEASGQVVVNSKLAHDEHLHVGQHVQFATVVGLKPVTVGLRKATISPRLPVELCMWNRSTPSEPLFWKFVPL